MLRWAREKTFKNLLPQDARTLSACSTLPLPKGEAAKPYQRCLCLNCGSFGAAASLPALMLSEGSRHLEYAGSCQCTESGETITSPLGSTPKSQNTGHILQLFPAQGRSQELGVFSSSLHTKLRGRAMVGKYMLA